MRFRSSVREPARAAGLAGRWHAEQSIAPCGQPGVKNWSDFRKRPDRENRHKPFPTRQDENYFDPSEVTFTPAAIGSAHVHLFRHLFARVWRRALQDFRVVVIQPLDATIAIERLHARAHPTAQIATAVGVDFDLVSVCQRRAVVSSVSESNHLLVLARTIH